MPLEPMDGLIIDLRNVPLVLCGGFLGRRASLIYFCMTETTRFGLGCIGMLSGILATTIAVCAGGLLVRLARPPFHYKVKHLVFFYYMASLHFCAAVVLEEPAQSWFLENASAPIAIFNLASITIAAHLLDAEELKITREYRLAESATLDTDHGAMMKSAFVREIALRMSSRMMDPQPGWF